MLNRQVKLVQVRNYIKEGFILKLYLYKEQRILYKQGKARQNNLNSKVP